MTKVTKQDIGESSGSLQVCARHKSGSETAVHAKNSLFQHREETDSVASGCVKSLQLTKNRAAALHNIRDLCLALATFAINTCRSPARLFETGVKELISAEGTTQGRSLSNLHVCP